MTAVLGGLLFVQPEGYSEAQRDVIRLSPDILALEEQVSCCEDRIGIYVLSMTESERRRLPLGTCRPFSSGQATTYPF